ncbi:serine hydrolase [Leptodesmis sichuanensis]|uniref:serine hydrolase n=1 Tax=Leptodesmis sichuanensis TaxID=2906798 RepID=UPI001F47B1DA|nr:serine hydrolase [Leptodesmis sichuanensis]UIE39174.1 serine hydrolase [Leptodesmis sichuanensis A121]
MHERRSKVWSTPLMAIAGLVLILLAPEIVPATGQSISPTMPPFTQPVFSMTPKSALERLFNATSIEAEWFAPTFLAQVPIAQVQQIIASIKAELRTYQGVESEGEDYRIVFERGFVPTKISLNANGQISGLFFQPARLKVGQLSDIVAAFKALPGQVSLLVLEDGTERIAFHAHQPLAVGSTFKLAVLATLIQQIQSGQHSWEEVVSLQGQWKSLPSGVLQTWPDASLLTVQSLAALMISQSDNTATDHLMHLVGREAIEAVTLRNRPFLSTREAFVLKSRKNFDLLQQYRLGDEAARRQLLQTLVQKPLPTADEFTAEPVALDVEWFFTTTELCNLMAQVKDLPLMSINPGVAQPQHWQQVAYKGGSEAGVLNLTTGLKAKDGKQYCVSATWNNTVILDESRFFTLYTSLLELLK